MKRSLHLILYILIPFSLFSQLIKIPYQEVGFKNLTPIWIYSPIDSSLIGDGEFNGRNHFNNTSDDPLPFVIDDEYLYCAHHTSYGTLRVEGALLTKIDLKTGKPVWQNHYDLRNNDKQEWIEAMFIDNNGVLNVITDRRIILDNNSTYDAKGDKCMISIRKYNTENGQLIDHIKTDTTDKNSLIIKNSLSNKTILFPIADDKFQYYEIDPYLGTLAFYNIDQHGHLLTDPVIDTFRFPNNIAIPSNGIAYAKGIYKVSADTLVSLDFAYKKNNNIIDTQTVITIYDKNLNISNQFQLDSMLNFNYRRLYIRRATHDYIFISGDMYTTGFYDTIANIVVNYKGKIIKQFTSVYDGFNHFLYNIFQIGNDPDFYLTTTGQRYYGLDFVKTNDTWQVDLYREFYAQNKNYLFSPYQTIVLENNDLLIFGYNNAYSDYFGYYIITWPTWMRISGEDLGFRVSTNDLKNNISLSIYPNPASNSISISCEDNPAGSIEIIDRLGRVMYKEKSSGCEEQSIDISGFCQGLYFVRMIDGSGKLEGKGKFVKE